MSLASKGSRKVETMKGHTLNLIGTTKAKTLAENYLEFKHGQETFAEAAAKNISNQTENSKRQLKEATDIVLLTSTKLRTSLTEYARFLEKHANSIHSELYKKAQMKEDAEDLRRFASELSKYGIVVKKLQDRLRATRTNYSYTHKRMNENLRANVAVRKIKQFGEPEFLSMLNLGQVLNRTLPTEQANMIKPTRNVEGIGSLYGNTNGGYRRRRTVKRRRN